MSRLITSIVLLCLCLVTTGEIAARSSSLLSKVGVSQSRTYATIALSVADITEEFDNVDRLIPVANGIVSIQCDRSAVNTIIGLEARNVSSDDEALYIAIRRLLI